MTWQEMIGSQPCQVGVGGGVGHQREAQRGGQDGGRARLQVEQAHQAQRERVERARRRVVAVEVLRPRPEPNTSPSCRSTRAEKRLRNG